MNTQASVLRPVKELSALTIQIFIVNLVEFKALWFHTCYVRTNVTLSHTTITVSKVVCYQTLAHLDFLLGLSNSSKFRKFYLIRRQVKVIVLVIRKRADMLVILL